MAALHYIVAIVDTDQRRWYYGGVLDDGRIILAAYPDQGTRLTYSQARMALLDVRAYAKRPDVYIENQYITTPEHEIDQITKTYNEKA